MPRISASSWIVGGIPCCSMNSSTAESVRRWDSVSVLIGSATSAAHPSAVACTLDCHRPCQLGSTFLLVATVPKVAVACPLRPMTRRMPKPLAESAT